MLASAPSGPAARSAALAYQRCLRRHALDDLEERARNEAIRPAAEAGIRLRRLGVTAVPARHEVLAPGDGEWAVTGWLDRTARARAGDLGLPAALRARLRALRAAAVECDLVCLARAARGPDAGRRVVLGGLRHPKAPLVLWVELASAGGRGGSGGFTGGALAQLLAGGPEAQTG